MCALHEECVVNGEWLKELTSLAGKKMNVEGINSTYTEKQFHQ